MGALRNEGRRRVLCRKREAEGGRCNTALRADPSSASSRAEKHPLCGAWSSPFTEAASATGMRAALPGD